MKKFIIIGSLFTIFLFFMFNEMYTNTSGSPTGRSGGAGELTCATSSCHSGTANSGPGSTTVTSNAVGNEYIPGNTYTITVTVDQTGTSKFGFLTLVGYSATSDASTGTIQLTNTTETRIRTAGNRDYVTHRSSGVSGTDLKTWSFDWVAPPSMTGEVSFFVSGNATNNGGNRTGDQIYTSSLTLTEQLASNEPDVDESVLLEVFPSYTQDQVNLRLINPRNQQVTVQAMSLEGKVVYEAQEKAFAGMYTHTLSAQSWNAGLYYVRVTGETFSQTHKVLKY